MFVLLMGVAVKAHSQQAPALPDTSYRAGEPDRPVYGMTLDQAQQLATRNSPALRAARAALRRAQGARMSEAGEFDPVLYAESRRLSVDSPETSPFAATELRQRFLVGGVTWLSPLGTTVGLGLTQTKTETNAAFSTLPRERRAQGRLDLVQPLLRGFGPVAARGELRALDHEQQAARRRYGAAAHDLSADVENAYWELYAAERDLESRRLQRQRAAIFLRDQMLRGRAGVVGPGATAAARTFLADQEVLLLDARIRVGIASDRLLALMGVAPGSQHRLQALEPPPPPGELEALDEVVDRAMRVNASYQAAQLDTAAALARVRRAARNAWPDVEAFGHYGGLGVGGTGREIDFGGGPVGSNFDTDFGTAWDAVWNDDNPDWSFGVRLNVPIGWRSDRGELLRQRGAYESSRETLRERRLALEADVRRYWREAEISLSSLRAMRDLVAAAREQARIGRLEYQAGRATAYDLVDLEAELAQAELRETQVLVRVARASTELRRLTQPPAENLP